MLFIYQICVMAMLLREPEYLKSKMLSWYHKTRIYGSKICLTDIHTWVLGTHKPAYEPAVVGN